ncbi:MAG: flavodoxin family protein [Candidatus ainarchaeum sp.]|nr:flavodoxin family protein [Candidatus ainarchaeum sp.]
MKRAIVYESLSNGNTEKVARAMATVLDAKLIPVKEARLEELIYYDMLGFGSGIFAGSPYRSITGLVGKLPDMKGHKAFVFSTGGEGNPKHHRALKEKVLSRGFDFAGEFCCKGEVSKMKILFWTINFKEATNPGQPNEEDLENARIFAKNLLNK